MKRILTVLFAMMLSVAVLAGCNKGTGADADKDAAAKTATKVTATAKTTAKKTEAAKTTKATKASKAAPAPTAEQFVDGYFKVIGGVEQGTAGSSLKLAKAAEEAFAFAQKFAINSVDNKALRDNMLKGWESMSAEEQNAFDANFLNVVELLKDVSANKIPAEFEDAGVADQLKELLQQKGAYANWDTLTANTLTMGNSEE